MENYIKKPFGDRLKDTGFLLKNSFKIIGKDKDILKPTVHMAAFSAVMTTLLFFSLFGIFTGKFVFSGFLTMVLIILVLTPFKFFYYIRQKADQSWIVYNTITGKDIDYPEAHRHTGQQKSSLKKIALIDILINWIGNRKGERGIKAFIVNLLLSALVEIWDLLSHYMIPAVVVEQKPLTQIIGTVKSLRNNVPATLVGVFGIDFAGSVIGSLFGYIYFGMIITSLSIGIAIAKITSSTVVTFFGVSFSWVPLFIGLYLVAIIGGIFKIMVESTKVIYFTIFYASITHPMDIPASMRNELTHFLLMDSTPPKENAASQKSQNAQQLSNYIKQYIKAGHTEPQIRNFLLSKGYKTQDINNAFNLAKKN